MKILAVGAHPDDVELRCYGTLARYAEDSGNEIHIAAVCRGNAGTKEKIDGEKLAAIRRKEAEQAAGIIGARYTNLGVGDGQLFFDEEKFGRFLELVRSIAPDVILTHPPSDIDWHNDHYFTQQLVISASIWATHQNIGVPTEHPPVDRYAAIFYWGKFDGPVTHYVDITRTFEKKKQALACHESQLKSQSDLLGADLMEGIEMAARQRGNECGVKYAEAFQELTKSPHVRPARLLP